MAPQKPKRPSMLRRQQQLRQQQQQVKNASSNRLPPSGGTGASRPRAVAQRTATAVRQRVNQDVATLRALGDNMRRNQARSARQIPADPSPSVRRVGPGGANPPRTPSLPPGNRGGDIRQRGGPIVPRPAGGGVTRPAAQITRTNNGGPVLPVRVRDLGSTPQGRLPGQRGLPGGTGGADSVRGSGSRTGRPGPNRPALPAGSRGGALATRPPRGGLTSAAVYAAADAVLSPVARAAGTKAGELLRPLGRAIDDRLPGVNSKDEARRNANRQPKPQMTPAQNAGAVRLGQASPSDVGRRLPARPSASPTRSGSGSGSSTRGGGGTSSGGSTRSSASSRPSAPTPRFNGSVDEGRQMWAQKYSSDKYKGQAIQKEAQALLEKLKAKKGDNQSAASRAGWDGNKNY